MKQMENIKT